MSTRNQRDQWAAIEEDLKRLQSEEPPEVEESGHRVPCWDESCVGTLGEDGRCRLCGKGSGASPELEAGPGALDKGPDSSAQPQLQEDEEPIEEERVCCSDESCVGTVDETGHCRICGLKWKEGGYLEGETFLYKKDDLS